LILKIIMSIEDYKTDSTFYTSLNNELLFEPRQKSDDSSRILARSIKNKIKQNILNQRNFFIFLQTIYVNTYLFSKSLEISPFINNSDHEKVSAYSYTYDLSIIMFITYALNVISTFGNTTNVIGKGNQNIFNRKYILFYCLTTILSALGFALLGEVSFFKDFTISGDFWKHLTLKEIVVFAIIGIPLAFLTLRELYILIKRRSIRSLLIKYVLISSLFVGNLLCLKLYGATNIHYHIHHAIFAGVMSIIFNKWDNIWSILMHAIYMGVLIEGISFYGLQELYIFMTNDSPKAIYSISFTAAFISLFLWIIFCLMFYKKLYD